jgi:hypothetical protein
MLTHADKLSALPAMVYGWEERGDEMRGSRYELPGDGGRGGSVLAFGSGCSTEQLSDIQVRMPSRGRIHFCNANHTTKIPTR